MTCTFECSTPDFRSGGVWELGSLVVQSECSCAVVHIGQCRMLQMGFCSI